MSKRTGKGWDVGIIAQGQERLHATVAGAGGSDTSHAQAARQWLIQPPRPSGAAGTGALALATAAR